MTSEGRSGSDERPRLLLFFRETSGASRRVEGYLATVLQRRANHDTFKVIRIDVDRRPELATKFRVETVPTLLVIDAGRIRARVSPTGRREIESGLYRWLR